MSEKRNTSMVIRETFHVDGCLGIIGTLRSGGLKVGDEVEILTRDGQHLALNVGALERSNRRVQEAHTGEQIRVIIQTRTSHIEFQPGQTRAQVRKAHSRSRTASEAFLRDHVHQGDTLYLAGEAPDGAAEEPGESPTARAKPTESLQLPEEQAVTALDPPVLIQALPEKLYPLKLEPPLVLQALPQKQYTIKLEPPLVLQALPQKQYTMTLEPPKVTYLPIRKYNGPLSNPQITAPGGLFSPRPRRNGLASRFWCNGHSFSPPRDHPGLCSLKIENGTERDAVVKMVSTASILEIPEGVVCRFVYICAKSSTEIQGIGWGKYRLLFCTGTHWDNARKGFTQPYSAQEFLNEIEFEQIEKGDTMHYSRIEVTLHPVPGGSARLGFVDVDRFDRLQ